VKKPILYQFRISPFCDKVRRAMYLKGIPWDVVEVPLVPTAKFKAISPTGKFPAVDFGGEIIVDSSNILQHLERLAPVPALFPADPRDRADALILEDWADESLYFFDLTMRNWPQNRPSFLDDLLHAETGLKRTIMAAMVPGAVKKHAVAQGLGRKSEAQVIADLTRHYDALTARLEGRDWLAGNSISIADIAVRAMHYVIDRTIEGKRLTDARPALGAWAARVDRLTLA
jgi:glutathione S-transferase